MDNYTNHFVSPLLTAHSKAYTNDESQYISEKVFPIVQVKKDTGQLATYTMDNLRVEEALRAQGGSTKEVNHSVSIGSHYVLREYALKELVTKEDMENADDPIRPKMDSVEQLLDRLWVIKEKMLADQITATATMTQNTTLTGNAQWNNHATSDPFGDIKTAKESVRSNGNKIANTIILSHDAWEELLIHPDTLARFPGAPAVTSQMVMENLGRLFGPSIRNVWVGSAQYNSADEGAADSLTDIWSKVAIVAYIETRPALRSRSLGFTYQKTASRVVEELPMSNGNFEGWDRKGDFVRVTDKFDQQLVDVNCGYLIKNAIA
jgi:hypothetical protein